MTKQILKHTICDNQSGQFHHRAQMKRQSPFQFSHTTSPAISPVDNTVWKTQQSINSEKIKCLLNHSYFTGKNCPRCSHQHHQLENSPCHHSLEKLHLFVSRLMEVNPVHPDSVKKSQR